MSRTIFFVEGIQHSCLFIPVAISLQEWKSVSFEHYLKMYEQEYQHYHIYIGEMEKDEQ